MNRPARILMSLAAAAVAAAGEPGLVTFDHAATNAPPDGWLCTLTGTGQSRWTLEADTTAPSAPNVLEQSGEATYPLCLLRESVLKDGFVEVRFKTVAGQKDQAAGVVWRVRDSATYYVCRANALENNVVLYKTENGQRKALDIVGRSGGYGVAEPVAGNTWHTLRVEFHGPRFKVLFNGKNLFEVHDSTFADAGKVGLWTKADSVTRFDEFRWGP